MRALQRIVMTGSTGSVLTQPGATISVIGDGTMAIGSAAGIRNGPTMLLTKMGGMVIPTPWWLMAYSGTTIGRVDGTNNPWINPFAIEACARQAPHIAVFGSCGANDNVLNVNPVGNVFMQDWKDAVTAFVAANPLAEIIAISGTIPSNKGGEATWRTAAAAAQAAHVASITDPRVIFIAIADINPVTHNAFDTGQYVHPDTPMAEEWSTRMADAIKARMAVITPDQVINSIRLGTYANVGANLDADIGLAGSAGTVTAPVTGSVATSKLVSTTSGAAVAASMVATTGGRQKIVLTLTGKTATAAGNLLLQDKANLAAGAAVKRGQFVVTGWRIKAPAGFINMGADWGNYGTLAGGGASLNATPTNTPALQALDTVLMTPALPIFGVASNPATKRSLAFRFAAGALPAGVIEAEQAFAIVPNTRTRRTMKYLGDILINGTGATLSANYVLRPTGTVSQAAGGTVTIEPGMYNLHGLTEADFAERRVYVGAVGDTAVNSGTLLGTVSGATWAVVVAAGAAIAGQRIFVEITDRDGNVVRSKSTLTVT